MKKIQAIDGVYELKSGLQVALYVSSFSNLYIVVKPSPQGIFKDGDVVKISEHYFFEEEEENERKMG